MSYYTDMKKNRQRTTQKLKERVEKEQSGDYTNPNEWRLKRDKADNGFAIIRFLPASEKDYLFQQKQAEANGAELDPDDVVPWILLYKHGFKVNGKWFINECPRTIGNECPVCDAERETIENGVGWDRAFRDHPDRVKYSQRKGKKQYWSNILVVKDSANPENEGKVFMFSYGEKIHEKLIRAMNPEFEDEQEVNPFCPWAGANFKLKAQRKDGYINYDSSSFTAPSPISDDDDEIVSILSKAFFLGDLLDPKRFKEYDKLEKDYQRVVNGKAPARKSVEDEPDKQAAKQDNRVDDEKEEKPSTSTNDDPPFDTDEPDNTPDTGGAEESGSDGDMDYYKALLDDD